MKYVTDWWAFALLALATFRVFHLIAEDTIIDRPRRKILRIAESYDRDDPMSDPGDDYRLKWGVFITCPWCVGFWIGVAWWGLWLAFGDWALVAATPFALSALVGALAHYLEPA